MQTTLDEIDRWLDEKLKQLLSLATELLAEIPSTGDAAHHVMRAAQAVALSRRQADLVYRTAITQLRMITEEIGKMESRLEEPDMANTIADTNELAEKYRQLIVQMNPRVVVGDLL